MQPIRRSQLVSVTIPVGTTVGGKVFLPDIPELRDALIDGLETYVDSELSFSTSGVATVTGAQLLALTLNLVQNSDRRGQDIPAWSLRSSQYGGIWKELTSWNLNWQKCSVQVNQAGLFAAAASFSVNVFYHYPEGRKL